MSEFDISILNRLIGKSVKGTGFESYDTKAEGGNENNIFDKNEIKAIKKDFKLTMGEDGSYQEALSSIFDEDSQSMKNAKQTITQLQNTKTIQDMNRYIAPADNTRVTNNIIISMPQKSQRTKEAPRDGRTAYLTEFNNYIVKNLKQYKRVLSIIQNYKIGGKPINIEPERAEAIAKMVCSLSDDYGITPEIVINILAHESGGFNFSKVAMGEEPKKGQKKITYKGPMQVDLENIECLYGYSLNDKHPDPIHNDRIKADHKYYYQQDQARIEELKKKYKTPQELFDAMATDVALGVEVGIMAYKGKLSRKHGDTKAALRAYQGIRYNFDPKSVIPDVINPIPYYKKK